MPFFREVIDEPKCTNLDAILYGYIYWLTKLKNERCTASTKTLAELCKSTEGSIRVSLTALEKAGFIQRKYKDDNPRNERLEIIPLLAFGKVLATANRGVSHNSHEVLATVAQNKSIEEEHINTLASAREIIEVFEDTDGSSLVKPKSDPNVTKAAKYFHSRCLELYTLEPSGGLVKSMSVVKRAHLSLPFGAIRKMMDDWFEEDEHEPADMMQITRCLSNFRIDKFKANSL